MNITERNRPTTFAEVIGQDHVVKSLSRIIEERKHSSFILEGPSGIGKTTLARICATELGCTGFDLHELDAASNSGVDDMRALADKQNSFSMSGGARVFIIDECQRLSKNAWDALLKAVEEPPEGNYWFFCTTEISKVPKTIQTRCAKFKLKAVGMQEIMDLLTKVRDEECLAVDDMVLSNIAGSAGGSPREALVRLQQADGLDEDEMEAMLEPEQALPMAFDLARLISKNSFDIKDAMGLCTSMKDESPEGIRQVVRAYFTTFVLRAPSNKYALGVLAEFEKPAIEQNRITDIVMRLARINKWK